MNSISSGLKPPLLGSHPGVPAVDISIAVATDAGLITPIIRGADKKPLQQIAAEARLPAARPRPPPALARRRPSLRAVPALARCGATPAARLPAGPRRRCASWPAAPAPIG